MNLTTLKVMLVAVLAGSSLMFFCQEVQCKNLKDVEIRAIPNYLRHPDLVPTHLGIYRNARFEEDHQVIACLTIENLGWAAVPHNQSFRIAREVVNASSSYYVYMASFFGPLAGLDLFGYHEVVLEYHFALPNSYGELLLDQNPVTFSVDHDDDIYELREHNNVITTIYDPDTADSILACEQLNW